MYMGSDPQPPTISHDRAPCHGDDDRWESCAPRQLDAREPGARVAAGATLRRYDPPAGLS